MREHVATVAGRYDLAAVLCLPEAASAGRPAGAILLLGGSGAHNRDGDLTFGGSHPPEGGAPGTLRRIAHHLAHHGLASLRWDRRGFGASGGDPARSDYASDLEDAVSCFRWIEARPEIDRGRIGVAGHSAGALTACQMCRDVPGVAAAGLLGALASPIEDMLRRYLARARDHWDRWTAEQRATLLREAPAELLRADTLDQVLDAARRGQEVVHLEGHGLSLDVPTARLRQDLATDYAGEMRHVRCPALVLHGGDDLNVPVEDASTSYAALRRAGNDDVELVVLPGLEHYFNPVSPDRALRPFERISREALRRPMSELALGTISSWAVRVLRS